MLPPIWDPELMAAEVRRCAAKGCHAVSFSENPSKLKLPSFHDDHWDPFWQACVDEGTIVCLHIGSSSRLVITAPDAPVDVLITLQPVNIVQAAADLVWSPVLRKFPDLRVALSEGGIGWIPYFCDRIDWIYTRHHAWTGQDFGGRLPERGLPRARRALLHRRPRRRRQPRPHGHRRRVLGGRLPPLRFDVADLAGDAVAVDRRTERRRDRPDHPSQRHAPLPLRPFGRPLDECTVGALRARATDVDVTPTSARRRAGAKTGAAELIDIGQSGKR